MKIPKINGSHYERYGSHYESSENERISLWKVVDLTMNIADPSHCESSENERISLQINMQ